jgi:hypothetical protein
MTDETIVFRQVSESDWSLGDLRSRVEFKRDADSAPELLFRVVGDGRVEMGDGWNPDTLRAVADWLERQ